ncbi:hypothetical protein DEU56DRAFT_915617 [Suillus clintonianus]|uniref:uncharacterized protein n=1 Tax=Suillus clintonianus TaxID=1904413 RepID=UPI001B876FED|nr:uncharacterized protein DEU56DRAFT_915617 [Suillus clintonianus]KAG2128013.1 hypothetical protein DEU56DRAFT_915617 [Suillus clintonianus]
MALATSTPRGQSDVHWAIIGGQRSGIYRERPFITQGLESPSFVVPIQCPTLEIAQEIYALQSLMAEISNDMSPMEAGQVFRTSNTAIVVLRPNVAGFYVVVIGYQCGIYLSWRDCKVNVTGYQSPLFKKLTTFTEAMEWFITKGGRAVRQNNTAVTMELAPQPSSSQVLPTTPIKKTRRERVKTSLGDSAPPLMIDSPSLSSSLSSLSISPATEHLQPTPTTWQLPDHPQPTTWWLPDHSQTQSSNQSPIYSYIREISGIQRAIPHPLPLDSNPLPSFGFLADIYLQAHGYTMRALLHGQHAVHTSDSHEHFSRALSLQCMPITEAMFLWNLISMDADYNDGPLET